MASTGVAYAVWSQGGDVRAAYLARRQTAFSGYATPLDADPSRDAGSGETLRPVGRHLVGRRRASRSGVRRTRPAATRVFARRLVRGAPSSVAADATLDDPRRPRRALGRLAGHRRRGRLLLRLGGLPPGRRRRRGRHDGARGRTAPARLGLRRSGRDRRRARERQRRRAARRRERPRRRDRGRRGAGRDDARLGDPRRRRHRAGVLGLSARRPGAARARRSARTPTASPPGSRRRRPARPPRSARGCSRTTRRCRSPRRSRLRSTLSDPAVRARPIRPPASMSPPTAPATRRSPTSRAPRRRAGGSGRRLRPRPRRARRHHDDELAPLEHPGAGMVAARWTSGTASPTRCCSTASRSAPTQGTRLTAAAPVLDGLHRWQVIATDVRGQVARSATRNLRIDSTPPRLIVQGQRQARAGQEAGLRVRAVELRPPRAPASGACGSTSVTDARDRARTRAAELRTRRSARGT